jgi:hypothetical protein
VRKLDSRDSALRLYKAGDPLKRLKMFVAPNSKILWRDSPFGETAAASVKTRAAPPTARALRCAKCQSLAKPLSQEYWHIGETPIRLANVTSRTLNSLNKWDTARLSWLSASDRCYRC